MKFFELRLAIATGAEGMPFTAGGTLHLLRVPARVSLLELLTLEEALLRADSRNWCLLARGAPSPPTVVLGMAGKLDALVHVAAARAAGARALRRFTGGGTVVVDGGTALVSFVCARGAAAGAPLFPRDIMAWSGALYAPVFAALLPPPAPPFSLVEHDYCLGDRKFGGNAQAVSRERWVHHTSFLWRAEPAHMALLKLPEKRPAYRRSRAHGEFLTTLAEHAPAGAGVADFEAALVRRLRAVEGLALVEASLEEALEVLPRNERRSNEVVELVEGAGNGDYR